MLDRSAYIVSSQYNDSTLNSATISLWGGILTDMGISGIDLPIMRSFSSSQIIVCL